MRPHLFFRSASLSVATVALLAASAPQASAQTSFPTGTVRFVAPFSASTPPDIISRIVSKELTEAEGWRVIVENRPGGVTTIAATDVLTQPADGNSLYAMSVPSVAAPSLVPNISFNLDKDFDPVIKATVSYNVLVVNPSVPAKTIADLVALLKSQPDKLTFSSGGFGTPAHLIGEQFKQRPARGPSTFPMRNSRRRSATCSTAPTPSCLSPCCRSST